MSGPKLLLVDELSLGLMPKMVDLCIGALQKLNTEEGLAIVLVEQNTARALEVAHQVCVLASGRSVFTGPAEMQLLTSGYYASGSEIPLATFEPGYYTFTLNIRDLNAPRDCVYCLRNAIVPEPPTALNSPSNFCGIWAM